MADLRTPASCYACCCPFHQGGQCGVIPGCRPAMTGPPPRPASFVAAPGRPIPLCRSCYPGPDGASPCSWNTLRDQHPEAQFPEDPHHVVPPPPRHQRPGGRWADGQQHRPPPMHIWRLHPDEDEDEDTAGAVQLAQHRSPETLLPPRFPSPNARVASQAGYGRRDLTVVRRSQVKRGPKGTHAPPEWGANVPRPLPLSPGEFQFIPCASQIPVSPPPHLIDVLWWTPHGLHALRGPVAS